MVRGCMHVWTYNCRWYVNPKNNVVLVGVNNTFSCKSRKSLPILLPGGAVTPAINDTTGLAFSPWLLSWRNSAALSSAPPPISPIRTIPEKYHVTQSNRWQWHKLFCANTLMSLKKECIQLEGHKINLCFLRLNWLLCHVYFESCSQCQKDDWHFLIIIISFNKVIE